MNHFLKFILLFLVFLLVSCSKNTKEITRIQPISYYPLQIGNTYIYDVDSVVFDDFNNSIDTFKFQIQEMYSDTFRDNTGNLAYKIERRKRNILNNNSFQEWGIPQIWWVNLAKNQSIQRVENNLRYVNIVSPIENNFVWNGNVFNILPEWKFRYINTNLPFENYDSTLTVIQREIPVNLVSNEYYEQKFAKNIGLIFYHFINVEYKENINSNTSLIDKIKKGVIFTQKLNSYSLN
jgi:hypothetical protein